MSLLGLNKSHLLLIASISLLLVARVLDVTHDVDWWMVPTVHHTTELIPKMLAWGELERRRKPIINVNIVHCRYWVYSLAI